MKTTLGNTAMKKYCIEGVHLKPSTVELLHKLKDGCVRLEDGLGFNADDVNILLKLKLASISADGSAYQLTRLGEEVVK